MDDNDVKNFERISNLINSNDILVDVGANSGDYTEFFKIIIGDTGKIYSIELAPETYELLKNKFSAHENIIVLNKAVSNTNEPVTFYKGYDSFTNNIIGHDMNYKPYDVVGTVDGIRLDTLLENEKSIKLIKIDVEGAENLVLEGMEGIIKKVEYLLVECHLDEDWPDIRNRLINIFDLECVKILDNSTITNQSSRPYQCLCKQK